jgi:hypothetical protein
MNLFIANYLVNFLKVDQKMRISIIVYTRGLFRVLLPLAPVARMLVPCRFLYLAVLTADVLTSTSHTLYLNYRDFVAATHTISCR